jgi:hypothetical protein
MGFTFLVLLLAQGVSAAGWGEFFPWSVTILYSQGESLGTVSYLLVGLTSLIGLGATLLWWERADQARLTRKARDKARDYRPPRHHSAAITSTSRQATHDGVPFDAYGADAGDRRLRGEDEHVRVSRRTREDVELVADPAGAAPLSVNDVDGVTRRRLGDGQPNLGNGELLPQVDLNILQRITTGVPTRTGSPSTARAP